MRIFEKILLGFLILVFIVSLLSSIFYGTFSFYSFFDALTNTLLWGIPCLFIWVIVKIFIHFTKKKEKTEKTEKIEETEKVEKTENISKKIITLVLIVLITINTIFWLNVTIKTFESGKKEIVGEGKIDWSKVRKFKSEKEEIEFYVDKALADIARENTITYRMARIFEGKETMLITFLILTDAVLIAIYFMMIPLYKKE